MAVNISSRIFLEGTVGTPKHWYRYIFIIKNWGLRGKSIYDVRKVPSPSCLSCEEEEEEESIGAH